jgi:hypothetical protein
LQSGEKSGGAAGKEIVDALLARSAFGEFLLHAKFLLNFVMIERNIISQFLVLQSSDCWYCKYYLDTKEEGKTALLSSPFPFAEIRGHFSQTKKLLLSESQKYIIISKK